jgi:maleate cis-trans isomerase
MSEGPARVGIVLPSSNTTVEADFQRVAPTGVTLHSSRIWLLDTSVPDLEAMNREAESAVRYLASAEMDVIAYACTSGSFLGGPGHDEELVARLAAVAGRAAVVCTSPAAVQAMRALDIQRVGVVTPYTADINERLGQYLGGMGFEVTGIAGADLVLNLDIGRQTPEEIAAFARSRIDPEADGYFLSCTNWRAMEVAGALERQTGKPVVTSNQATIWAAFRALGINPMATGSQRLFAPPA